MKIQCGRPVQTALQFFSGHLLPTVVSLLPAKQHLLHLFRLQSGEKLDPRKGLPNAEDSFVPVPSTLRFAIRLRKLQSDARAKSPAIGV